MPWKSIGSVTPNYLDWRLSDNASLSELLRVRQTWNGDWPGTGYALVTGIYADGGTYGFRRIYPSREATMLVLEPPEEMQKQGFVVRYLAAKLGNYTRLYGDANWRLTFEEFYPSATGSGASQTLDGGVY